MEVNLFNSELILIVIKWVTLLILLIYAIFSLLIVKQVDLMSKTLISTVSPIVKAISILQAGFAVGLIVLAWGLL